MINTQILDNKKFYIRMLLKVFIVVMIISLSLATPVSSDPPEIIPITDPIVESIPGQSTPINPSPAPGFRYNPDNEIRVFNGWVESWSYSNTEENYSSDYDQDAFGDCSYIPRVYGPNVFSDFISFSTFAESSWYGCAYASANDFAAYSYAITANQNVISFSTGHIAEGCTAYAGQDYSCCYPIYAGFTGGYYYPNDYDLTVRIPFSVSDSGFLLIQQSDLTLLSMCSGEGPEDYWDYGVYANAHWSIIGTDIDSDGELEVYDITGPNGGQNFYDGWDQNEPHVFPIDAGSYCLRTSYYSWHGGDASAPYNDYASALVSANDQFTVTIRYLPG